MKSERLNGGNGCNSFDVVDTLLKKYNGNDEILRLPGFIYGIGDRAFAGNASLKKIILSSNVNVIGENAFDGCVMLTSIIFNGTKGRWHSVKKGEHWLDGTPDFIISCRDGYITKQEEIEFESEPQVQLVEEEICDEPKETRQQFLERRRRELIAKMQQEIPDIGNEDDEDEYEEIIADSIPSNSMWGDDDEFDIVVMDRLEKLVRSDLKMARRGAIKKAEIYLEAIRETRDGQMMQVYERIVYELKITSDSVYNQIRNYIRNE